MNDPQGDIGDYKTQPHQLYRGEHSQQILADEKRRSPRHYREHRKQMSYDVIVRMIGTTHFNNTSIILRSKSHSDLLLLV